METSCQKNSLEITQSFSKELLAYINKNPLLDGFYSEFPEITNFKKLIQQKQFSSHNRSVLVTELEQQYAEISNKPNIAILKNENTYTLTSGHQLNIYSGPLYIIYKIITIINLAKKLKESFPEYNFVPIYWMATEDHDLEEIDHFSAFGQNYNWQTNQKGAVGRMHTEGLAELGEKLGTSAQIFQKAYAESHTLADAVRKYMHALFGSYGLISIDADTVGFKSLFKEVMREDICTNNLKPLVDQQSKSLENLGFKTQISAREINFFYLKEDLRERLIRNEKDYAVMDTDIRFTVAEMDSEIENHCERFSPNVVLRPLYQEMILPNLAYIGGPSEIIYWLQLKSIFEHFKVPFPALMPRNMALLIDERSGKRMFDLRLETSDLFLPKDQLKNKFVQRESTKMLDLNIETFMLKRLYELAKIKAESIDTTLIRTADAFATKSSKLLETLEKKLLKAEKKNHQVDLIKIDKLKEALFPGDVLQERKENILSFLENHSNIIALLIDLFDPFDFQFNTIQLPKN